MNKSVVHFETLGIFAEFCACLIREGIVFTAFETSTGIYQVTFTGGY
jgi:hypothetical protein|tara:strand:- start:61 stop:201 length:141 start_codon:yes stop_codon:yes gene_type:complete